MQEESLSEYILECAKLVYGVSAEKCRLLAFELALKNQKQIPTSWLEKQKAGKDWMYLFFQRHPNWSLRIRESCSLARAMCFNQPFIQQFFDNLDSLYTRFPDILQSKRVYNIDQTATTTVRAGTSEGNCCLRTEAGFLECQWRKGYISDYLCDHLCRRNLFTTSHGVFPSPL